jgi:hypothetical protein
MRHIEDAAVAEHVISAHDVSCAVFFGFQAQLIDCGIDIEVIGIVLVA